MTIVYVMWPSPQQIPRSSPDIAPLWLAKSDTMMDARHRAGRRPSDGRQSVEVSDLAPRFERPSGEACPICTQFSAPIEELVLHIIVFHKYEDAILRTALDEFPPREGEYICATCRRRLRDSTSLYRHLFADHRPELFDLLQSAARQTRGRARSHDLQPLLSRFSLAPPQPPPEDSDHEEDERYVQFIAGSIQSVGIAPPRNHVEIAPIRAAKVEARRPAPVAAAIDRQFWDDLDRLDACLRATRKIYVADGEFKCKICRKKYNSGVRLLEHCWEVHRNLLDD
jgi:hypothetical protein